MRKTTRGKNNASSAFRSDRRPLIIDHDTDHFTSRGVVVSIGTRERLGAICMVALDLKPTASAKTQDLRPEVEEDAGPLQFQPFSNP